MHVAHAITRCQRRDICGALPSRHTVRPHHRRRRKEARTEHSLKFTLLDRTAPLTVAGCIPPSHDVSSPAETPPSRNSNHATFARRHLLRLCVPPPRRRGLYHAAHLRRRERREARPPCKVLPKSPTATLTIRSSGDLKNDIDRSFPEGDLSRSGRSYVTTRRRGKGPRRVVASVAPLEGFRAA